MKRIFVWVTLSGSLLTAAPAVDTHKRSELISTETKKSSNRRGEQILNDLTKITVGVGCCVASMIALTWGYQAGYECAKHNEFPKVAERVASKIGWGEFLWEGTKYVGSSVKDATWGNCTKENFGKACNWGVGIWERVPSPKDMWKNYLKSYYKLDRQNNAEPVPAPVIAPRAIPSTPERTRRAPSPEMMGSPLGAVADKVVVHNYAKAVGLCTVGLISGIVGIRLVMKGLHIEFSKAKKKQAQTEEQD